MSLDSTNVLTLPFRAQWEANNGYCGEASLISSALYKGGTYMSQYDVRILAASNPQNAQSNTQLLIGKRENDLKTINKMHLKAEAWHAKGPTKEFLLWVKAMVSQGHPVAIGLYMNQYYFTDNEETGDKEYDHIVTVTGVTSKYADGQYHGDDILHFSDHGLWNPEEKDPQPEVNYQIAFDEIQKDRKQANWESSPIYSLRPQQNYGVAITGILDPNCETKPIQIQTNIPYEPTLAEGSNKRPASIPVRLKVTVSELKPGQSYTVYRYDDMDYVPDGEFHKKAYRSVASRLIQITSGSTYTFEEEILSHQTVVYRAVPVN